MLEVLVWKKLVQRGENGLLMFPWFKDRAIYSLDSSEILSRNRVADSVM
jgi:hypothetical protein